MIKLTDRGTTILVNPDNISTIMSHGKGSKLHMNDGSVIYADDDILDIMQKIVNNHFGIEEGDEQ